MENHPTKKPPSGYIIALLWSSGKKRRIQWRTPETQVQTRGKESSWEPPLHVENWNQGQISGERTPWGTQYQRFQNNQAHSVMKSCTCFIKSPVTNIKSALVKRKISQADTQSTEIIDVHIPAIQWTAKFCKKRIKLIYYLCCSMVVLLNHQSSCLYIRVTCLYIIYHLTVGRKQIKRNTTV